MFGATAVGLLCTGTRSGDQVIPRHPVRCCTISLCRNRLILHGTGRVRLGAGRHHPPRPQVAACPQLRPPLQLPFGRAELHRRDLRAPGDRVPGLLRRGRGALGRGRGGLLPDLAAVGGAGAGRRHRHPSVTRWQRIGAAAGRCGAASCVPGVVVGGTGGLGGTDAPAGVGGDCPRNPSRLGALPLLLVPWGTVPAVVVHSQAAARAAAGGQHLDQDKIDVAQLGSPPSYQIFPLISRMRCANMCAPGTGCVLRATCGLTAQHSDETR